MKASWKRILSLLLVAAMILTLGPTGFAVDLDEEIAIVEPEEDIALEQSVDEIQETEEGQSLWVGGVEVTEANASDILGDGKASFNFATNTLTFTAAVTFSGVHEGAIIYADTATPLTIVMPSGHFDISNDDAEVGIYTENGLIVNGNLSIELYENEDGYGIKSMNGPVTITGAADIWAKETGIYCGKGDVTIGGASSFACDSYATLGFCPASLIYAADGGVNVQSFALEFGYASYAIYADGDITVCDTLMVGDKDFRPGRGLYSENGKIVCEKDVTIYSNNYAICAVNSADGITLKGETNTIINQSVVTNPPVNAPCGAVNVTGDLTVKGGGLQLILAKNDITIGGDAVLTNGLSQTTVNPYNGTIMRSEEGSVIITGDCTVKGCADSPIYAYDSFTVIGDVSLTFSPHTLRDWGIKTETGAIDIGGKLSSTGKAMVVALGDAGVTIGKDVSIKNVPEGGEQNYGIQAPNGKITFVSGKWDVETGGTALYAKDGIEIPDGYGVALPERGLVVQLEDAWTVTEPDKETVAAHAIISDKVNLEDGYYLIKPDWSVFEIASTDLFIPNPNNEAEYMLNTTLDVGEEIKVVRLENGAIAGWYPDGMNNQYYVDEAHSGDVTVYFKTSYDANWAEFGGFFYIGAQIPSYTVTWVNWNGDVLEIDENVLVGVTPTYDGKTPQKAATEQFTYTFKGWDPEIAPVAGDVTYTATYTENERKYYITFWDYDYSDFLYECEVSYGETPVYAGETPTRSGYVFKGWSPEIVPATSDADYVATYARLYLITFVNWDDTVLQSSEVAAGETPVYSGETPTKAGTAQYSYTFKGWEPEIVPVTRKATYKAVFEETVNEYTVRFVNDDGTELQSTKVPYGETPKYEGETPTKAGTAQYSYTFKGWDPEIVPVVADATYTATYTETVNEYTVRFVNDDGTELQSTKLAYGETPKYEGETPTKAATAQFTYTFKGWDPEIAPVTADATYTATYTETVNEYTVKFVNDDGTVLQESKVPYGETPVYSGETPTKAADAQYSYTFKGWDPEIVPVVADATYTATYDATPLATFELLDTEITVPAQSEYQLRIEGEAQLTWSSSDEKVATVDENGKVFANLYGKAVITVTDGKKTMSCTVNVLFSDVVDPSYYFAPVYWAAENGITKGYETGKDIGKFGVGFECQRRELLIFLWRYAGEPTVDKEGNPYGNAQDMFNDLGSYGPTTATNKAIAWACTEGITKGYSDGGFHPKDPIVRKDVMILLYRLAGKPSVTGTLDFPDCQGSPYTPGTDTYNAILWGSQNAITKGYSDGTFGPLLNCLREQIVTFLYRYDKLD